MIAWNDRSLVLGPTGSGKSTLLNAQTSAFRCQRAVFDSKDEWSVRGVEPVAGDVDRIDWRQPIVHFIPGDDIRGDTQRFFTAAFQRTHVIVAVHELADLCEYNANATPPAVSRYLRQGRAHGRGLLGSSQRPVEMPKSARTEAEHVFVFPGLDPDDMAVVAAIVGRRDAQQLVDEVADRHGEHGYVYFDKRGRQVLACPPLPEHIRSRSVVTRRSVA